MNEQRLRDALRDAPLDDAGARARTLRVVRAAYAEREPVRPRRRWAPALALAACALAAVVLAASVSAPGDAVARWVRDVLGTGRQDARPALVRVPGGGRLAVSSERGGAWIVAADGARRRIGGYDGASWSPHGLYVVAWRGGELLAVEPGGRVRWSLARSGTISFARWAPVDGFRIAYRSGTTLRVVDGDGTGRSRARRRARGRARVAAGPRVRARLRGRPRAGARGGGRLRARAVADRAGAGRARAGVVAVRRPPARRHAAPAARPRPQRPAAGAPAAARRPRRRRRRLVAARRPRGRGAARRAAQRRRARRPERHGAAALLFTGSGRFGPVAWSPSGRRLLVPWPEADQWLFLSTDGGRIAAVANIRRQFAAGPRRSRLPRRRRVVLPAIAAPVRG